MSVYAQAADWLERHPDRWIKGDYFTDGEGRVLEDIPNYTTALEGDTCFCVSGLLFALMDEEVNYQLETKFEQDLDLPLDVDTPSLTAYNDSTELDDIIRRLRNADQRTST